MNTTAPLINLFGKQFNIPSYQRGYRWGDQEVTELLDDLWEFQKAASKGEFYCLQPIVLKRISENEFDVIDGQQRLTTLYLILVFLEDKRLDEGYNAELFRLIYETRKDCEAFLLDKRFAGETDTSNIDYFHICHAYQIIKKWFDIHPGSKGKLTSILMDVDDGSNKNVKLIWYEIANHENPIDAFIRLNIGKIPLTDAELIKALLLQSDKYSPEKLERVQKKLFKIASEWDQIEYKLQEEEFWYFLNNEQKNSPTHIEFIFDLIAKKKTSEFPDLLKQQSSYQLFSEKGLKHSTYLVISKYIDQLTGATKTTAYDENRIAALESFWNEVSEYFQYFLEWFNQRDLFHYVGYLIVFDFQKTLIETLIGASKKLTKKDFRKLLEKKIEEAITYKKRRENELGSSELIAFSELNYDSDSPVIHKVLLLHNVITTLNSDKELARFPFNLYKKTKEKRKWSLEHIHAQNSEIITNQENQQTWIKDHIKSLQNIGDDRNNSLINKLEQALKQSKLSQDEFNSLFEKVNKVFDIQSGFPEEEKHKIGNLCLIDAASNSQLNNSVFDVKREKLKKRELEGHYIPICTRNAFLKAYSTFPRSNAFWTDDDRKYYVSDLQSTLNDFFPKHWQSTTQV